MTFRPCIFLGTGEGAKARPTSCWRSFATFEEARSAAFMLKRAAQLFSPMYSGWVEDASTLRTRVW